MSAFTRNQRRSIARRNVGLLDDGSRAVLVHKNDTEDMARAVFAIFDPDIVFVGERRLVEWCAHTDQYRYDHGCDDGYCDRPSPRFVWVARYPVRAAS